MKGDGFKLRTGKLLEAWRQYPAMRKHLKGMPSGPPIFITGTHRSGTTWAAAMLAVPGIWYVHEPFSVTKGLWRENFTYVPLEAASAEVDPIMEEIVAGGHRRMLNLPWAEDPLMPLRLFPHRPSRILLKDPLACLMSAYLTRRFGLRTLVLFRHPAGFVASLQKLGWPTAEPIRKFLANEALMADWLAPYQKLMENVCSTDDTASAAVLCGCLNRVLWGYVQDCHEMTGIQFEDLCEDPIGQFRLLFEKLGLDYDAKVENHHKRLCFSHIPKQHDYRTHEVVRNSHSMKDNWRNKLDKNELASVRVLWESFEIPLYHEPLYW